MSHTVLESSHLLQGGVYSRSCRSFSPRSKFGPWPSRERAAAPAMRLSPLALAVSLLPLAQAFSPPVMSFRCQQPSGLRRVAVAMEEKSDLDELLDDAQVRSQVEAMRVKQIKAELDELGVAHSDAFEKEDLVQRLIDAKAFSQVDTPLTMDQAAAGMDMVNNDEDGRKILEEMQSNKRLLDAAMDIAQNGLTDKYEDDEEVMDFMRRLEAISKRQA